MNIEEIQQYCKSLPGVTEDVKWEDDLCFNIGGKMFAVASLSGGNTLSFKVTPEEFDLLIETIPLLEKLSFIPSNYSKLWKQDPLS